MPPWAMDPRYMHHSRAGSGKFFYHLFGPNQLGHFQAKKFNLEMTRLLGNGKKPKLI